MRIRKDPLEPGFVQIPNETADDARLSFKARGLLVHLLSKPDGWETSVGRISSYSKEGKDAIQSALHELEEYGYLTRVKKREGGRWSCDWTIRRQPKNSASTVAGFPQRLDRSG